MADKFPSEPFPFVPFEDVVIIEEDKPEEKVGSIFLPDTAKSDKRTGRVVAAGPGKIEDGERLPMVVGVGDRVMYTKYAGDKVTIDGKEYQAMHATQLYGRVPD